MDTSWLLIGLIISITFGFTAGNYACSLVHRLPRGRGILEKKPYCGECLTMLQTKDLFPVFSAFLLGHKCRYCRAPIPKTHFYTELALGLLFCLCFVQFGFSQLYVLVALLGCALVTLASIHHNENVLMGRVAVAVIVCGMLIRILLDGNVFNFFFGGFWGLMIGCIIWHKQITKEAHVYHPPLQAQLLAMGGICVGESGLAIFLLLLAYWWLIFWLSDKARKPAKPTTPLLPFSLAVIIPTLFGDISLEMIRWAIGL